MDYPNPIAEHHRPSAKPFGFCCTPNNDPPEINSSINFSVDSLRSLHECPALRLRERVVYKRPPRRTKKDARSLKSSSALKVKAPSLEEVGGVLVNKYATDSEKDLIIERERKKKQAEYEERMDRWALIGEINSRKKQQKRRLMPTPKPHWYVEYSIPQLQKLKDLEDTLFKDNEEKTTCRTYSALFSIGMMTQEVQVDPRKMARLVNEYSVDPVKFLYEVYKAINGNYFDDEHYRKHYSCSERIILSGIAFLELPKIILELHDRLPPVHKLKRPPKPARPRPVVKSKKTSSPLLEKMHLHPDMRLYMLKIFDWKYKLFIMPRPVAILPKRLTKEEANEERRQSDAAKAPDKVQTPAETIEEIASEKAETEQRNDEVEQIEASNHDDEPDADPFPLKTDWTSPPTPCPYKYRKLLDKTGPLIEDEEFFAALNRPDSPKKILPKLYPCRRENLSTKVQQFLLDVEADFFHMTEQANRLSSEVGRLAKDILEPDAKCDGCCPCRQTRKSHLRWHATKAPHKLIEGTPAGEEAPVPGHGDKVIGALAMHSPASSLSAASGPACVPSHDKLVKDMLITGDVVTVDGEIVKQVGGMTKNLQHIERELLLPDQDHVEIKNVYPCACHEEKKEKKKKGPDKDCGRCCQEEFKLDCAVEEGEPCYATKFRPKEQHVFNCQDFGKKDEVPNDCGCLEEDPDCVEEDCGCSEEAVCFSDDTIKEKEESFHEVVDCEKITVKEEPEKKLNDKCNKCGMEVKPTCWDKFPGSSRKKTDVPCKCDSFSEFLEIDLTKLPCAKAERKRSSRKSSLLQDAMNCSKSMKRLSSKSKAKRLAKTETKMSGPDDDESKKIARTKPRKKSRDIPKEGVCTCGSYCGGMVSLTASKSTESTVSGPYGLRTASEEALPVERTIAYLVDHCPPDYSPETVPVRPGGRPCRCRENRNKRKVPTLGIDGLTMKGNEPMIDRVYLLTPEPSIRRSDEYIVEYELYDSPYERQMCGNACGALTAAEVGTTGAPCQTVKENKFRQQKAEDKKGGEKAVVNKRAKDWNNAFQDPYLETFFTKNPDDNSCWTKCSTSAKKAKESRKLRVMKPVCECKNERKIVKRNENRKMWRERQQKLKSMKKQAFLHMSGTAKVDSVNSDEERIDSNPILITAVTMQTPYDTPVDCLSVSHLPYQPLPRPSYSDNEDEELAASRDAATTVQTEKSKNKRKDSRKSCPEGCAEPGNEKQAGSKEDFCAQEIEDTTLFNCKGTPEKEIESDACKIEVEEEVKKRVNLFDQCEEDLMAKLRQELENMSEEGFLSLKLPHYHKMLQLSYWISYRCRGMHFTKKYKKDMMVNTIKMWSAKSKKGRGGHIHANFLQVSSKIKMNFDRAMYLKRKIKKLKTQFYNTIRQEAVNISQDMWRSMEFGKFPNAIFKQAYFTYLPANEADAYVIHPFP